MMYDKESDFRRDSAEIEENDYDDEKICGRFSENDVESFNEHLSREDELIRSITLESER